MNKFLPLLFCFMFFSSFESSANEELEALDSQLRTTVETIELKYGITVSYAEQQEMKVSMVAKKIVGSTSSESMETKILNAVSTYEIDDQDLQRKLVIQVGTNGAGNGGGAEPPKSSGQ